MHNISLGILKILDLSNDYVTAQYIADQLHVSRRTIFNNLEYVRTICDLNDAEILCQKSKGYKLKGSNKLHSFLKRQGGSYIHIHNIERKLYTIYLLLIEDEPVRISELEAILYVSRPTVYKIIEEAARWFAKFDIELVSARSGIIIAYGERRYREALKCWIAEVIKTIQNKEKNNDFSDRLKLKKSAYEFLNDDFSHIRLMIETMCDEFHIHCSMHEIINLAILMEVVIYRNKRGHTVSLSNRLLKLITDIYTEDKIKRVADIMKQKLDISFAQNEIVYLITNCLINGDFEDKTFLNNRISDLAINDVVYNEIAQYIKEHLNLETVYLNELMKDIIFIIKREILFQIKGDNGTSAKYYNEMTQEFNTAIISTVHQIYSIISNHYNIAYHEKMICNLMFCLLNVLIKSMKKLNVALIHNCDVFEIKYVMSSLQSINLINVVIATDNKECFESYCTNNDVDLVLSTVNYSSVAVEILEITKIFGAHEMNEVYKKINTLYQKKNLKDLINKKE